MLVLIILVPIFILNLNPRSSTGSLEDHHGPLRVWLGALALGKSLSGSAFRACSLTQAFRRLGQPPRFQSATQSYGGSGICNA